MTVTRRSMISAFSCAITRSGRGTQFNGRCRARPDPHRAAESASDGPEPTAGTSAPPGTSSAPQQALGTPGTAPKRQPQPSAQPLGLSRSTATSGRPRRPRGDHLQPAPDLIRGHSGRAGGFRPTRYRTRGFARTPSGNAVRLGQCGFATRFALGIAIGQCGCQLQWLSSIGQCGCQFQWLCLFLFCLTLLGWPVNNSRSPWLLSEAVDIANVSSYLQ